MVRTAEIITTITFPIMRTKNRHYKMGETQWWATTILWPQVMVTWDLCLTHLMQEQEGMVVRSHPDDPDKGHGQLVRQHIWDWARPWTFKRKWFLMFISNCIFQNISWNCGIWKILSTFNAKSWDVKTLHIKHKFAKHPWAVN